MALSLKESRAMVEVAKVFYTFLPGSGSSSWRGHVTFESVARDAGVSDFWTGGSKEPAIARLLELTLERRRSQFEPLILGIVREGIKYRQKRGNPISESEIVMLNGLIKEVGFKFPDLWDDGFLKSLKSDGVNRASQIIDEEKATKCRAAEKAKAVKELEELKGEFLSLVSATDRQKAGLQFEKVLSRIFDLFGLEPRLSYRVTGEQIDGSVKLDNEIYLVEAKWEAFPMGEGSLLVFRGKIEGKSSATRGIFISANGFTKDAMAAIARGKQPNFFLIDGYDLSVVLHGHVAFDSMLREKQRRFAEEGKLLHRISLGS